jgi:surface antigen
MPMLRPIVWLLASTFTLIVVAPDGAPFASAFAFAAGSGSGAGSAGKARGDLTQDNRDSLSAFMASPAFTRVADTVPSSVEAGKPFPLRGGLVCQRMTQTIKIDGQSVHASALMCRHPNGAWKIAVPPGTPNAPAGPSPPADRAADRKSTAPRPSPTGSPVAKAN